MRNKIPYKLKRKCHSVKDIKNKTKNLEDDIFYV